ncbi:MAG: monovalent cation/H+ antiporter complex subunit F [Verrucomicrobiae bacterium]|nr:monovalent cation/H+ antiporter complex subunit F [Verrucomicrobiae bacterium]
MSWWLVGALQVSLVIHAVLLVVCLWRVWHGRDMFDRLMGADLVGTLVLAQLVLLAMLTGNTLLVDVALGLVVLGFIGTVAIARYLGEAED